MEFNELSNRVIGCAIEVYRELNYSFFSGLKWSHHILSTFSEVC